MTLGRRLAQATAAILLLGFLVLLAVHITSIITNTSFFPFPEAFLLLTFVAIFLGIVPTTIKRIPASEYHRRYLGPLHPLLRWLPLGILAYSAIICVFLSQSTRGDALSHLPPTERRDSQFLEGLCIQSFSMAVILFGALVAWARSTHRPE